MVTNKIKEENVLTKNNNYVYHSELTILKGNHEFVQGGGRAGCELAPPVRSGTATSQRNKIAHNIHIISTTEKN